MTTPVFPAVGEDGKIRENHLPSRLSDASLTAKIQSTAGTGVVLVEEPHGSGLFVIGA